MMLMPASAEFAALCQSQLAMMTELVGADSTAVYLAESWSDQKVPNLLPIAFYPGEPDRYSLFAAGKALPEMTKTSAALLGQPERVAPDAASQEPPLSTTTEAADPPNPPQRLAIPMMHDGGVFGVLVSWRTDHPWRDTERDRLEECARSLTLACVLDQRGQWLKSQMSSLDQVQAQQSDRFHELLHQLRSPLTALKTFGKLLTKRLSIEDPNRRLVTNMLREGDRMQELLGYFDETLQAADDSREETASTVPLLLPADDLGSPSPPSLTASTGSLAHFGGALTLQPLMIAAVALPLVELTQPLAEDADMSLEAIAPAEEVPVLADPKALTEVLSILIDNSLKYATPGSQIWMAWGYGRSELPGLMGIILGDTGPGIPPEDQARIFERHYRGLQAAGEQEGSGLGLAIAADLVHEMHGHIDVVSPLAELSYPLPAIVTPACQHGGTAFIIWLSLADAAMVERSP